MLFKESIHIQDVLLQVALGHSLVGSQSCLAALSKDIFQHSLETAIEEAYWESRSQEGLLTPKPAARDPKFPPEVPEMIDLPDHAIRRAVARPISTAAVPLLFTHPSTWRVLAFRPNEQPRTGDCPQTCAIAILTSNTASS